MPLPIRYEEQVPEIVEIWEAKGYFKSQLRIWMAECEAFSQLEKKLSKRDLKKIKNALVLSSKEIEELTIAKGHETNKLLRLVQSKLPAELGNYIHKGNTSSDVLDTSLSLQIIDSLDLLILEFRSLHKSLEALSKEHKNTLQVGRTHTQQAIPQTFGRQVVGWYAEIERGLERLERAREVISVGKLSGEVGTNVFIDPKIEEIALSKLGLKPDPAPTQVISRDRHSEVVALLAVNSATLARIATNIRLLSMTEIGEVREPFGPDQQGSSAMPHKRNPELSERILGISRRIRSAASEEIDASILWLERDISHSSTERFSFPDVFCGLLYITRLMIQIVDGLEVDKDKMLKNLDATNGAIYSSRLMNALIETGKSSRTQAYELVKSLALEAIDGDISFSELALKNPKISKYINGEELRKIFDPKYYTKNINVAYKRSGIKT